jgi:hypothetical protein
MTSSRRTFLRGAAGLSGVALGIAPSQSRGDVSAPAAQPSPPPTRRTLTGIDPKNVVESYRSRALHELSDRQLFDAAAAVVAEPKKAEDSFTIHAPLELVARFGLLPLVAPKDAELARIQIVASAAVYQEQGNGVGPAAARNPFPDRRTATRDVAVALAKGDQQGLEAAVLQLGKQFGVPVVVQTLTPLLLPSLTLASHSHIGLWLLLRHGGGADVRDVSLLRTALASAAADPKARLSSFSGMDMRGRRSLGMTPAQVQAEVLARLERPPQGTPGKGNIRGIIEAGERSGAPDRLFGDLMRKDLDDGAVEAAFSAIMRTGAHIMVQEGETDAHRFTLAQAACGLSSWHLERKLALASALVWITAYRSRSTKVLDFQFEPEPVSGIGLREALEAGPSVASGRFWHADPREITDMQTALATEASVRGSQHVVKYTRACFDMCGLDPASWRLYLAAAATLIGKTIPKRPRNSPLEQLPDMRG